MRITILLLIVALTAPLLGQTDTQAPPQRDNATVLLEALGVFSGVGVYMSHAAVGSLVDAHEGGIYDREMTLGVIGEYIALNQSVVDYLTYLTSVETLDPDDVKVMSKLRVAYMLINEQLMAYAAYLHTNSQSELDTYAAKRDEAWGVIADIYGFNQEGEQ